MADYMYNENHKIVTRTITKIGFSIAGTGSASELYSFLKKKYENNNSIKFEVESDWDRGYFKIIVTCPNVSCLMSVIYNTTKQFANDETFYFDEPFLIDEGWA